MNLHDVWAEFTAELAHLFARFHSHPVVVAAVQAQAAADPAAAPVAAPVPYDWRTSPITQAESGTGGNVQPGTANLPPFDARSLWRHDTNIDKLGFWLVPASPAGVGTTYTVTATPGAVMLFTTGPAGDGMAAGKISANGIEQAIVDSYATLQLQAQDAVTTLTIECDHPVLLQRAGNL